MKKQIFAALSFFLFSMFVFTACDDANTRSEAEDVKEEMGEMSEAAKEAVRRERAQLNANMDQLSNDIDARIAELQAKMDNAGDDAKAQYKETIDDLKEERDDLKAKMASWNDEMAEDWNEFKRDFNNSMQELRNDLSEALSDEG